jgi:hypothetical protein
MPYEIAKENVWASTIEDRPGGLAEKLEVLAEAGASLEFVIARRAPENPGTGVVFVAPISGAAQTRAARKVGFSMAKSLCSLRVSGPDKAGLGARVSQAVADAGINMRGLSAAAIGRKCVFYFAFDSATDAGKAARVLKKTLNPR